jgi:hypothetical protein
MNQSKYNNFKSYAKNIQRMISAGEFVCESVCESAGESVGESNNLNIIHKKRDECIKDGCTIICYTARELTIFQIPIIIK